MRLPTDHPCFLGIHLLQVPHVGIGKQGSVDSLQGSTYGLRDGTAHYTEPGRTLHPPLAGIKGDAKSGVTLSTTLQPLVISHA